MASPHAHCRATAHAAGVCGQIDSCTTDATASGGTTPMPATRSASGRDATSTVADFHRQFIDSTAMQRINVSAFQLCGIVQIRAHRVPA
eukprot:5649898-Prymnesium_polylepis.1